MESNINLMELKILHLATVNKGNLDEITIENSELKKLGVGRILDLLASLKERKLIEMTENRFAITKKGRDILWNKKTPLWTRILRLLSIKSLEANHIAKYLNESENTIIPEIEQLRKEHLVLMSSVRENGKLKKIFEIMQEGKGRLEAAENSEQTTKTLSEIINNLRNEINQTTLNEEQKKSILEKINRIKQLSNV